MWGPLNSSKTYRNDYLSPSDSFIGSSKTSSSIRSSDDKDCLRLLIPGDTKSSPRISSFLLIYDNQALLSKSSLCLRANSMPIYILVYPLAQVGCHFFSVYCGSSLLSDNIKVSSFEILGFKGLLRKVQNQLKPLFQGFEKPLMPSNWMMLLFLLSIKFDFLSSLASQPKVETKGLLTPVSLLMSWFLSSREGLFLAASRFRASLF